MSDPKTYDSRPGKEQLLARCKRDRVDPSTLREMVVKQGRYNVRCYGRPTTPQRAYDLNPATGVVEQFMVDAWTIYKTDRQGKVSSGWNLPYYGNQIIAILEDVCPV